MTLETMMELDPEPPSYSTVSDEKKLTVPPHNASHYSPIHAFQPSAEPSPPLMIRIMEDSRDPCADFFVEECDKIIIPFSNMDLIYSIQGNPVQMQLTAGQGFYVPKTDADIIVTMASCDEYLMIDFCTSLRALQKGRQNKIPPVLFSRPAILHGSANLLNFAHMARRMLLSPFVDRDAAIQALGVIAVSEILIDLQERPCKSHTLSQNAIAKLDTHIRENIDSSLRLQDLADLCQLSMHYFARSFKKATGKTPYQYILDRRISFAKSLLSDNTLSIAEVAYNAGFSSQSHMTELFRKSLGTTPGKYRDKGAC